MPLQECWEAKARIMDIAREDPEASTLERALEMSQFELSLVVAKNAFEQWVVRCGAAAGANGLSPLELLVLHMISHKRRKKRLSDISFGMKMEDNHTVSYAIKKLSKADLVQSERVGKETFYNVTPVGHKLIERYAAVRRQCLIQSLSVLSDSELDLTTLSDLLRALSGFYEQAARRAAESTP